MVMLDVLIVINYLKVLSNALYPCYKNYYNSINYRDYIACVRNIS